MAILSWFTLLTCLIIHTQFILGNWWIALANYGVYPLFWSILRAMLYLLYPLCGWIVEVYSKGIKVIQLSLTLLLVGSVASCIGGIARVSTPLAQQHNDFTNFPVFVLLTMASIALCLIVLGMYEANAIQFGMDQMLEASSEQLSSFIHWYFWCVHVGPLLMYYIAIIMIYYVGQCILEGKGQTYGHIVYYAGWTVVLAYSVQLILSILGLLF